MIFEKVGQPLRLAEIPVPQPGPGQVLLRVYACGVCRTDLHIFDGELSQPRLPLILGHEIIGTVVQAGAGADAFPIGQRVGVPWLGWTDGNCRYCQRGQENLCTQAKFTGYNLDGGYVEYTVADQRYCYPLPEGYPDLQAAPLLCAGLIGYSGWAFTALALRRTLSPRWRCTRGGRCTLSPSQEITRRNSSLSAWARSGPAARTSYPQSSWTRR